jgi:hypothetical protein
MDPELLAKVLRLLRWSHDLALGDVVIPDPEIARHIREVIERLERERGEAGASSDDRK